ncbi:WGR domain-containing protein [Cereibacter azotoformans]|uniref:WGR domain-containing protein n=1 Tax=Cereibacter sphaeroides (strain ATCC 17025 / ATH 2.4.3) TaxID=349102 RepID=A4WXS3_CERS5|nr:WGR domain-containing protein [Cereibacter azotoformans]ULB11642.1 WGR domain-containing protein [Cereibacter azotoformans]
MEIRLEKIEPERNFYRFYLIRQERDLFESGSLVVQWGRIGQAGRMAIRSSGPPERIEALFERLVRMRLRRGYAIAGAGFRSGGAAP